MQHCCPLYIVALLYCLVQSSVLWLCRVSVRRISELCLLSSSFSSSLAFCFSSYLAPSFSCTKRKMKTRASIAHLKHKQRQQHMSERFHVPGYAIAVFRGRVLTNFMEMKIEELADDSLSKVVHY